MENTDKDKIIEKWKPILKKFNIDEKRLQDIMFQNTIKIAPIFMKNTDTLTYNKLHSRIIICGYAAVGKDYLRKKFEDKGYKYGISYTTRPPRTGETNGIDYHFLTNEAFELMIANDIFYEHVRFNNWFYGTTKKQFYEDDIFIMTPHGISCIDPEDRKRCLIMFLDIPIEIRRERLALRNDADKVERRILADQQDFKDFFNYDIKIINDKF